MVLGKVSSLYADVSQRYKISIKLSHFSILVKPLTVDIKNPPASLVADRRYEVICESTGSRPNAVITWYKGKRQLRRTKVDYENGVCAAVLTMTNNENIEK